MGSRIGAYLKFLDVSAIQVWIGAVALGVSDGWARRSSFNSPQPIIALLANTFILFYVMSSNDYFDRKIDAAKGERSVMVREEIKRSQAKFLILSFAIGGLALAYLVSTSFFAFVFILFVLGSLYSEPPVRYKRLYPISTLGEIAGAFLLFPIGYSAVRTPNLEVFFVSSLTTLVATSYRFRHEARHVDFDRATGKRTLAVVHGVESVKTASRVVLLIGIIEVPILLILGYISLTTAALAVVFILVPIVVRFSHHPRFQLGVSLTWGFGLYLAALLLS